MAKSREIKRRIKAVGNIRRITKTMQMIATARFQTAQRRATASKPYSGKIAELVAELAKAASSSGGSGEAGGITHPLLGSNRPPVNRQLVLVITSNRGLCGGYNANMLRTAAHFLRENATGQIDLEVVGKKGLAYFKFVGREVNTFHAQFGDTPSYEEVKKLADKYMAAYAAGQYDSVNVIYMSFISMSRQVPRVLKLLPLDNPAVTGESGASGGSGSSGASGGSEGKAKPAAAVQYDFTPDPATLLNELLPITVETQLFQCFNEAVVGEQIARMVAMKAATDSAGKMGKELSRRYNRARQAAITTELSEIIAGAASLE